MRHELHSTNPIANVRQVRKRATDPSILEPAEIAAILKQLEGVEPVRTAFFIAAVMGMRRGEIFGLKWADVDFDRAVLLVRRSYVDGVEGPPKNRVLTSSTSLASSSHRNSDVLEGKVTVHEARALGICFRVPFRQATTMARNALAS
jgi:integrase